MALTPLLKSLAALPEKPLLKWSFMTAAIFWVLIYKLSQAQSQLPEFVYVNF